MTKAYSQCGFSIVHKWLWTTRLSHSGFKVNIDSGRPEYDHVQALSQHLKYVNVVNVSRTPCHRRAMRFVRRNGQTDHESKRALGADLSQQLFCWFVFYDPWHVYRNMAQCASHAGGWLHRRCVPHEASSVWFNTVKRGYCMLVGVETYVVTDLSLNSVFKCSRNIQAVINMTGVNTV